MIGRLKGRLEFWVMILAWVAHSLSTTSWSSYSLIAWAFGMLFIWTLYLLCRIEGRKLK